MPSKFFSFSETWKIQIIYWWMVLSKCKRIRIKKTRRLRVCFTERTAS